MSGPTGQELLNLQRRFVQDFERMAGRIERATAETRPWREEAILKRQAGELLIQAIRQRALKAPAKVIETTKLTKRGYHDHVGERVFDLAVDMWLSKVEAFPIRQEPRGLTHFNSFQLDPEEANDYIRGRMLTVADACRLLSRLIIEQMEGSAMIEAEGSQAASVVTDRGNPFVPTEADCNILQALADASTVQNQVEVVQRSGEPTRTVKDRLPILELAGLVNRPHGA